MKWAGYNQLNQTLLEGEEDKDSEQTIGLVIVEITGDPVKGRLRV